MYALIHYEHVWQGWGKILILEAKVLLSLAMCYRCTGTSTQSVHLLKHAGALNGFPGQFDLLDSLLHDPLCWRLFNE